MNRGEFGITQLPKALQVVSPGRYRVVNGCTPAAGGAALGTFAGVAPMLNFTIPADVLDQLRTNHW